MLARNHGTSFARHGKWLTSSGINDLLETNNKDSNILREMAKNKTKNHREENEITNA